MKKVLILLYSALLIFDSLFSFGQQAPGIQWQNTIGGNNEDNLQSIQQTYDGGYILGGWSVSNISGDKTESSNGDEDYWIVKTDSIGNLQWQNSIGGSGHDKLECIKQTADGGYIVGGWSNSNISGDKTENSIGGSYDYWIIKLDFAGNLQWQNTIGGSDDDFLLSVQQTADGGYILGGYSWSNISGDKTENNNFGFDYWVVKTDLTGNIQWQNTIGANNGDYLYCVQQTADGGYILGGYSNSNATGDKTENSIGYEDYWVVKIDSAGNIQWDNTIGGNEYDELVSIQQTTDGGYILCGWSGSSISGDKTENSIGGYDIWIVKTDSTGNIQWQNTIGGDNTDEPSSIQQDTDGGYLIGGWSLSNISGDKTENSNGDVDYWIIKTDTVGNIIWQNTIGGSDGDYITAIQQTFDGEFILGGISLSQISGDKTENCIGNYDYWIVKIHPATTTGISNVGIENYNLKVFPNPAKDEITITGYALQNNPPAVLKVYDVMGKEVFSQSILNRTSQIVNLKSFDSGVYFVQLQRGAKVSRIKFVKQ